MKETNENQLVNPPSSEEQFIANFFDQEGIKYTQEVKITNLQNDSKLFRRADFYLPNLRVYVEYFGLYNSTKAIRDEYDEKREVYIKNNIPTVFIYPHELGILEYAFHVKVVKLLKLEKFKLRKQLFRYRFNRYKIESGYEITQIFLWGFALWVLIELSDQLSDELKSGFILVWFFATIDHILNLIKDVRNYFYRDY